MQRTSKLKGIISTASGVVIIYVLSILLNAPLGWIYALYGLSVGASIWMTVSILKDPYTTDKTFNDYFYLDRPDIRRVGKE